MELDEPATSSTMKESQPAVYMGIRIDDAKKAGFPSILAVRFLSLLDTEIKLTWSSSTHIFISNLTKIIYSTASAPKLI